MTVKFKQNSNKAFHRWSLGTFWLHHVYMRFLWCKGYHHRKWTWWNEFKSWLRLIAFHKELIPSGKVWILLFSLQLWVNGRVDWVLQPWLGNQFRRLKTEFKPVKRCLKIDFVSLLARVERLVNAYTLYTCVYVCSGGIIKIQVECFICLGLKYFFTGWFFGNVTY